ncbi:Beta-lactamase protein [Venustampulla echinocandica]|uniref:Beta-lactamase protein n=1 Tax=Venustampulla echinocandica TaxID=2656787 RepID=A0A370TV00_9HELO|nr:Beta-lactamase protein [Venustampulla echinocandica]RDL39351.1 Beta-lactamase protein [Venustampulla echinocandica]
MAPVHTLKSESVAAIKKTIDAATADTKSQIPGAVFVAVNARGEELVSHASGFRGVDSPQKVDLDSVFWIASCTKMIVGIAAMQLIEQGKFSLDDADVVEKLAPELKDIKILKGFEEKTGEPILVEKKNRITLRKLLTHTAGFGYTFFNKEIRRYGFPAGIDEFSGKPEDMTAPLLFEPGEKFNYGTNIDWVGLLIERATGVSLSNYCQKNIFAPLGLQNTSFFPSKYMKSKLVHMSQRYPDGHLAGREHPQRAPLSPSAEDPEGQKHIFNSGGAGCFAQPREYAQIIATLLNNGTSPRTNQQILKPETVDEMFSNSIPELPNFGRETIHAANPELTNELPQLYPQPPEQEQGWGLTFMLTIHEGATGRGRNTGWWAGLPNLFWWCDRERGVGGIIASQILPFGDPQVLGLWGQLEAAVYQG